MKKKNTSSYQLDSCTFLFHFWVTNLLTPYLSVFSPNAENAEQNNSEYGHFLRNEDCS